MHVHPVELYHFHVMHNMQTSLTHSADLLCDSDASKLLKRRKFWILQKQMLSVSFKKDWTIFSPKIICL